jgi:hypothetical protein
MFQLGKSDHQPIYQTLFGRIIGGDAICPKLIPLCLIFLLAGGSVSALGSDVVLEPDEAKIFVQAVFQPLNRFLLIQRGQSLAAVIFISSEKNHQGEFIFYRAYQNSPKGWQPDKEDTIGMRKLKWWEAVLGIMGIHTPPLSRIKPLELKDFTLMALPSPDGRHAVVCFGRSTEELDPTVKLSPTPWREIKDVDEKDRRLKWFNAYSPEQKFKIDELWEK